MERYADGVRCPHCEADRVIRWGQTSGLPRWRCKGCRRTFTPLTGTPVAHLRRRDRWADYGESLRRGETLAEAAERCRLIPTPEPVAQPLGEFCARRSEGVAVLEETEANVRRAELPELTVQGEVHLLELGNQDVGIVEARDEEDARPAPWQLRLVHDPATCPAACHGPSSWPASTRCSPSCARPAAARCGSSPSSRSPPPWSASSSISTSHIDLPASPPLAVLPRPNSTSTRLRPTISLLPMLPRSSSSISPCPTTGSSEPRPPSFLPVRCSPSGASSLAHPNIPPAPLPMGSHGVRPTSRFRRSTAPSMPRDVSAITDPAAACTAKRRAPPCLLPPEGVWISYASQPLKARRRYVSDRLTTK
jgi:hypothetical protein